MDMKVKPASVKLMGAKWDACPEMVRWENGVELTSK